MAALAENHEAAQTLIEAEADPYINFNLSALMAASQRDMYGNCQTLLQYGADVDATDEDGITALMFASMNGHSYCVWSMGLK